MVFLLLVTLSWYHGGGGVLGDANHVVAVVDHLNKNYENDDVVVDLITEVAKRVDGAMQRRCLNSQLPWFLWHLTKLRFCTFSFFGCLSLLLWHFVQMLLKSIWPDIIHPKKDIVCGIQFFSPNKSAEKVRIFWQQNFATKWRKS